MMEKLWPAVYKTHLQVLLFKTPENWSCWKRADPTTQRTDRRETHICRFSSPLVFLSTLWWTRCRCGIVQCYLFLFFFLWHWLSVKKAGTLSNENKKKKKTLMCNNAEFTSRRRWGTICKAAICQIVKNYRGLSVKWLMFTHWSL